MSAFGQSNNHWTNSVIKFATSSHLVTQQPSISSIEPKTLISSSSIEVIDLSVNTTQLEFAKTCPSLSSAMSDTDTDTDGSGEMMISDCSNEPSSKPYNPLDLSRVHPERQYEIALQDLRQSVESAYEARSHREEIPQIQVLESEDDCVVISPESLLSPGADPISTDHSHNNKRRTSSGLIQPRRPSLIDTSQQTWNNIGRDIVTPIESMQATVHLLDQRSERRRKRPLTLPDPVPVNRPSQQANSANQTSPLKVRSSTSPSSHPARNSRTDEQSPKRPRLSLDTPTLQKPFSPPTAPRAMLRPSSSSDSNKRLPSTNGSTRDSHDSPRLLTPDSLSTGPPTPTRKDEWRKSSTSSYITIERQSTTRSVPFRVPAPSPSSARSSSTAHTAIVKPVHAAAVGSPPPSVNEPSEALRLSGATNDTKAGVLSGDLAHMKPSRWDLGPSETLMGPSLPPKLEPRDTTPDRCSASANSEVPTPTIDESAILHQQTTPRKPPGAPFHPPVAWSPGKPQGTAHAIALDPPGNNTMTQQYAISRVAEQMVREVQLKLDPEYLKLGLQRIALLTDPAMQITILSHWANIQRPEGQSSLILSRADKTDLEIAQDLQGLINFGKFLRDLHKELDKRKLAREKKENQAAAAAATKLAVRDKNLTAVGGAIANMDGERVEGKARSSTGSSDSNRTIMPVKKETLVQKEHADPRLRHKKIGPK